MIGKVTNLPKVVGMLCQAPQADIDPMALVPGICLEESLLKVCSGLHHKAQRPKRPANHVTPANGSVPNLSEVQTLQLNTAYGCLCDMLVNSNLETEGWKTGIWPSSLTTGRET